MPLPTPVPAKKHKLYSDVEKSAAVTLLMVNGYDFDKTARETGISRDTLRVWEHTEAGVGIVDMLEAAIKQLLSHMPENWNGNAWAVALGILMDKWLLINGDATSRTENVLHTVIDGMPGITDKDREEILEAAEKILVETRAATDEQRQIDEHLANAKLIESKFEGTVGQSPLGPEEDE